MHHKNNFYPSFFIAALMSISPLSLAQKSSSWTDHISLSGVVEFEAFSLDGPDGDESDADLATVELGLEAELSDTVSAYTLLLIEAPDHDVELDEGGLVLGLGPVSLNLGKQYVPFGSFESHMMSDPLTLEIGETNESAALISFESGVTTGSFYLFNGDVDEVGSDSEIDNFGASFGVATDGFKAGVGYINSIADSDGLGEAFEEGINDYPAGIALYAVGHFGSVTVISEYVAASDAFVIEETAIEPSAFNIEVGFGFEISGKEASIALGYQGTEEALALELPETKTLLGFSVGVMESTTLSLEYANETDYEVSDGGTGEDTNVYTLQVAVEF